MSVEKIRELLELMNENDLVEMEVEETDFKVKLRKPQALAPVMAAAPMQMPPAPVAAAPGSAAPAAPRAEDDPSLTPITSPIVGTFYRASSPEADPFVQAGTTVTTDTVVCIIEAMKIMNEIKAGLKGEIVKILVENGEPVEYGQTLFLVRT